MEDAYKYYVDLYDNMIQNVTSYCKLSNRMFEQFMENYIQTQQQENDTERITYPANGHDIYNYVARYGVSNIQIQAVLKFDQRLDFEKLKCAVRLSVDTEPILKCRFVEADHPRWEPLDNIGVINFCTLEETEDVDSAVQNFIQSSVDLDKDPMLNIKLIRAKQYDVLALKINHSFCDGGGTKEYIQLLADIYSAIDQENGTYDPVPRIGGRKDQDRLFEELGITKAESLFTPGSDLFEPLWSFPWEPCGSNITCMSVCKLQEGLLDEMQKIAKSKSVTINDFILTACYRAMRQMKQSIYGLPVEIPITVDLRRFLPDHKTQAIRNFSGSVGTKLNMIIDEPFNEMLMRVSDMMKEIKKGYPGLQSAIGLERVERINFYEILSYYQTVAETKKTQYFCPLYCGDKCVPTLSNVGYLSKSLIKFGSKTVIDAYILPPIVRAPGLLLMTSSYNSVLTLAAGYFKSTVSRENVDKLLGLIRDELIEGCKS